MAQNLKEKYTNLAKRLDIKTSQMCVHLLCRALTTNGMRNSAAREQRHSGKFYFKTCHYRVLIDNISQNCRSKRGF